MYTVGQILYVILPKKHRVIPVQVVEQITRKSISGEKIQYIVNVPGADTQCDLAVLSDEVYPDIKSVKDKMIKSAELAIDKMIEQAHGLAIEVFGDEQAETPPSHEVPNPAGHDISQDVVKVTLDDGTVANVNLNV